MARSKSSHRWLQRHINDPFVQRAQRDGYRSRAAYKLLEIQDKDRILRPGQRVVDLGAAPGGWSQIARRMVARQGTVYAVDLLPIEPLDDVMFIEGDFREDAVLQRLRDAMGGQLADLVMSDMAPNVSGVAAVDQPRSIYLCELALDFAKEVLKPGGILVVKMFQGEGFDSYVRDLRSSFGSVVARKPAASRPKSREVYLVARNYNS